MIKKITISLLTILLSLNISYGAEAATRNYVDSIKTNLSSKIDINTGNISNLNTSLNSKPSYIQTTNIINSSISNSTLASIAINGGFSGIENISPRSVILYENSDQNSGLYTEYTSSGLTVRDGEGNYRSIITLNNFFISEINANTLLIDLTGLTLGNPNIGTSHWNFARQTGNYNVAAVSDITDHSSISNIHVNLNDKNNWNAKPSYIETSNIVDNAIGNINISGVLAGTFLYASATTNFLGTTTTTVHTNGLGGAVTNFFTEFPARNSQTGQTNVYSAGSDDGSLRCGVPWPAIRFMPIASSGAETNQVLDALTGTVWARDASLLNTNWYGAIWYINNVMNTNSYGGASDWRLPSIKEMLSLVCYQYAAPALCNSNNTARWAPGSSPFRGVLGGGQGYLSGTTRSDVTNRAWALEFALGTDSASGTKEAVLNTYFWPVRDCRR